MKKYLLGLIALALVVAVSAFSEAGIQKKSTDVVWFKFEPVDGNSPINPANYVETGMTPECTDDEGTLCAVFAEADDNSGDPGNRKPLLSSLQSIGTIYGFEDYEEDVVHLRN